MFSLSPPLDEEGLSGLRGVCLVKEPGLPRDLDVDGADNDGAVVLQGGRVAGDRLADSLGWVVLKYRKKYIKTFNL